MKKPVSPENLQCSEATRRWIEKRMSTLGVTKRDFLAKHQWPGQYYDRLFTQRSYWTASDIAAFCNMLHLAPDALLSRLGAPVQRLTVPLIGVVDGGQVKLSDIGVAPLPPEIPNHEALAALRVVGPAPWEGATLYFERSEVVQAPAFGRLSYCETAAEAKPVVGVLSGASLKSDVSIVRFGTKQELRKQKLVKASPILWIRAG